MTNKISKAREALEEIQNQVYHNEGEHGYDGAILSSDGLHVIISKETVDTVTAILTTLASIDAERLGEAIATYSNGIHARDVDRMNAITRMKEAAATLHGLVSGCETPPEFEKAFLKHYKDLLA